MGECGSICVSASLRPARIRFPSGLLTNTHFAASPIVRADKWVSRQQVRWSEPSTVTGGARELAIYTARRNCYVRAYEVTQNVMPTGSWTLSYFLKVWRGGSLVLVSNGGVTLSSASVAKQLYGVAFVITQIAAGETLWVTVTRGGVAGTGGNGMAAFLTIEEQPLSGGVRTRFGVPC